MMRIFFGRGALVATCLTASAANAADFFSSSLKSYPSAEIAAGNMAVPAAPAHFAGSFALDEGGAVAPPTQSYWPLLYSALIPGLGELTMGYEKRGIVLIAAEAVAWTGYITNHQDGIDERAAYEKYADEHWDENRWVTEFPNLCLPSTTVEEIEACGKASSGSGAWPGYIPYIPKEQDKQHYYENLGKYDWYISGWDDWKGFDAGKGDYVHETDNRTTYRSMRQESNNSLDQADSFLWISVAARAFSLAETAIIIHKRRDDAAGGGEGSPISLRARPRGNTGGELALEVRFK